MNKRKGTILVVDDNKNILAAAEILLLPRFAKVITSPAPGRIPAILREEPVDVVLLDMNFNAGINSGNEGLYWLSEIKRINPSVQVVLFTAYADISLAVRGMKEGAADFVVKPWDNDNLVETLQKAYEKHEGKRHPAAAPAGAGSQGMFWGESAAMQQIKTLVDKVARTDANVLITGENGTGKEMVAREIHRKSARSRRPMVAVDMGAITETLFESELFGHAKGSFTDAHADRPGKFEAADGGTLFLDEIGNLSYHLQAKLLTALQQRSIVRVGSNAPIPVDIRLLCATNRDLWAMVKNEEFREDLLYRINTIHIHIPPLRERADDIAPLAEILLEKQAKAYGKQGLKLTASAKKTLKEQPWRGNVRELEHAIEKAVIINESGAIDAEDFEFRDEPQAQENEPATTLEEMECRMIRQSIERNKGNLSLVAGELGISRQTLYNKIKRFEL